MLNKIIEFCLNFFEMLIDVFKWVLSQILSILGELFFLILDLFMTMIETLISAVDLTQITALQSFSNWGLLPDQLVYVLYKINFAQGLTMLGLAFLARLTLNLIPAALTRI